MLLLIKVPELEVHDIVTHNSSVHLLSHAIMKYLLKNVVRLKQVVESPNPKLVPLEQYTKDQEKYLKWLADVEEKH